MPRALAAATAAVLLLTTAACGDDGDDGEGSAIDGVTVSGEVGDEPSVETTDSFDVSKTTSAEVVVGDGAEIGDDSVVQAKLAAFDNDGKLLQGNYDKDATERIDLSQGGAPWVSELVGAHIGSRVAVALPVTDVLGPQGAPQAGLDPDEAMMFVVDVVDEAEPPLEGPEGKTVAPPKDAPKVVGDDKEVTGLDFADAPSSPPGKLQVIPLVEGEGPEVQEGQQVTLNYYASVWGKGDKPFDNSYERGEPGTFPLASDTLIDGWVKGLAGVPVGSRVMLIIPPELGYGAQGGGPDIPGNATLVFVIDVLAAG